MPRCSFKELPRGLCCWGGTLVGWRFPWCHRGRGDVSFLCMGNVHKTSRHQDYVRITKFPSFSYTLEHSIIQYRVGLSVINQLILCLWTLSLSQLPSCCHSLCQQRCYLLDSSNWSVWHIQLYIQCRIIGLQLNMTSIPTRYVAIVSKELLQPCWTGQWVYRNHGPWSHNVMIAGCDHSTMWWYDIWYI